jgi:DHA2 family multidrug resistance protein-like MFS transporter
MDAQFPATITDGLPPALRRWAFASLVISVFLSVMDASVANVALPTIADDFHATATQSVTIVGAYQLIIVVLLLPLASLGEILGHRRIYLGGLIVFTAASLLCVLSPNLPTLTAARILQGSGAAGVMAINTALLRYIFPAASLGRAIGLNSLVVALGSTMGPSFAGLVLSVASWQWLFVINIPLGLVAIVMGGRTLPQTDRASRRFDAISALLTGAALAALLVTLQRLSAPISLFERLALPAFGLALLTGALARQWTQPAPLLPIDLFRRPIFALSAATSVCSFTAQMLAFVSLPFTFERADGFSAFVTGFLIVPWPLAVALTTTIAGRLADRYPAAILNTAGLSTLAFGLLLLAVLPPHPAWPNVAFRMAICGVGFGFFQPPNNRTLMQSAPRPRSGAASGVLGTARLFGQTTGAAFAALALAKAGASAGGISLLTAAGFAAGGAILSVLRLRQSSAF